MRLNNLQAELRRRGLFQRDLARALGVDRSVVSRIICGHRRVRARERRMVTELLGVPENVLFPARGRSRRRHPRSRASRSG